MTQRRIMKDLKQWKENPLDCARMSTVPINYREWEVLYYGPDSTPFENGVFTIHIKFQSDYPFKPPDLRFKTRIYHPNITCKGKVCLPELFEEWNPQFALRDIMELLDELIRDPICTEYIGDDDILAEFLYDREKYEQSAAAWTKKFAIPDSDQVQDDEKQNVNNINKNDNNNNDIHKVNDNHSSDSNDNDQSKQENKKNKSKELEQQNASNLQSIK